MTLQELLDTQFGSDGEEQLRGLLAAGANANEAKGPEGETPLHVAARRFRPGAIRILLEHGVDVNTRNAAGKTAYAHAYRRGFGEVADMLREHGAGTELDPADQFAVAVTRGRLDEAREILVAHPGVARTGNPEEDRLLADVAGRNPSEPVAFLIEAGADVAAPGLDGGTPLHQTAWFGQPDNARLLVAAGAPLDVFDPTHHASPIGWVTHGSRHSGGAEERGELYAGVAQVLMDAGAALHYPGEPESDAYLRRLLEDASPLVATVIQARKG